MEPVLHIFLADGSVGKNLAQPRILCPVCQYLSHVEQFVEMTVCEVDIPGRVFVMLLPYVSGGQY